MEIWIQDIRHALRVMRRNLAVTAVVVLALALGIGANSAIFSVVNAVLLRPLPIKDSGRVVQIWGQMLSRNIPFHFIPYPDFAEWQLQSPSFEAISAYRPAALNLTNHGEAKRLNGWTFCPSPAAMREPRSCPWDGRRPAREKRRLSGLDS